MTAALLIARLLLASVLVVAGMAKLADRAGSRRAVIDFGVPAWLATPLTIVLPLAELAAAAALLPASTAWWGALGTLALLLVFVGGISVNLARGRKPDCHCFGQLHSAPVGWKTLARNGVLAAVAGFVLWQGYDGAGPSAVSWLGSLSAAQLGGLIGGLVALAMLAGQWWFLVHLLRQNGRLLVRIEGLEATLAAGGGAAPSPNGALASAQPPDGRPVDSHAPSIDLSGLHGETVTLDSLRAPGKPIMLLFTDPNCGPCTALLPEIGRWQQEHSDKLTILLISRGDPEENRAKSTEHGLINVLLQEDWEVSEAYQVRGTPSAVLVRPDGVIGSPIAGGAEAIRSLLAHALGGAPLHQPTQPQTRGAPCPNCGSVHPNGNGAQTVLAVPKVGEPAPEIKLPDLEGKTVDLADFRGKETLVLLWNPGCGFCQRMLEDVEALEADLMEGAPKMLFVSAGTEEANGAMELSSTVVLDQGFSVGRAFGASGTPSAVLVDAEGNVASEVAVGAPAVLALARPHEVEA